MANTLEMNQANTPVYPMPNEVYDILKWVSVIVIPALATLVGTIGTAVNWSLTGVVVTIIAAIGTFIGTCIGYSQTHAK